MFRAKNVLTAQEIVASFLEAKLSSSEEELFGDFLEGLAIFVAHHTVKAGKSPAEGVDFEYREDSTRTLVSVKSGLNWGNSSQWNALAASMAKASRILRQNKQVRNVRAVLGVCYGKAKETVRKGFIHQVCGQQFWYMISGKKEFYKDIIEPLGYKAKQHNDDFSQQKTKLINQLTREFLDEFCTPDGSIKWQALVEFNSGNLLRKESAPKKK